MIYSSSGGSEGIGFAIPINLAKNVMEQLIDSGKVARGWLGVSIGALDQDMAAALGLDDQSGAFVSEVVDDSPADEAGLRAEDVIIRVDNKKVEDNGALVNIIANYPPGTTVQVIVWRGGKEKAFDIKLGERPTDNSVVRQDGADNPFGLEVANLTTDRMRQFQVDYADEEGVLVIGVDSESTAARKRVQPGDLIKSVDRQKVTSVSEFNEVMDNLDSDKPVLFRLKRGRSSYFVAIPFPKDEE
jgi:serine protease Do